MTNDLLAIIAAGGHASRMKILPPKSMLAVNGTTLLEITLRSILGAGVREVLVFTNRKDWLRSQRDMVSKFPRTELILDEGVNSTIELLYLAREIRLSDAYLFCYGHAPPPSGVVSEICCEDKPLGGMTNFTSTRLDRIKLNNRYLEPPFYIKEELLNSSVQYSKWSRLFSHHQNKIHKVPLAGPPEFNYSNEWNYYRHYFGNLIGESPHSVASCV